MVRALVKCLWQTALTAILAAIAWQISPALGSLLLFLLAGIMTITALGRETRLNLLTCALPPAATGLALLLQMVFLQAIPTAWLIVPALLVGGLLGLLRGLAHRAYARGRGVFVRRSVLFLLVWMAAYGLTQLCSLARAQGGVRLGLAGSLFSWAMLSAAGVVLLVKYARCKLAPAAAVAVPAGGPTEPPPPRVAPPMRQSPKAPPILRMLFCYAALLATAASAALAQAAAPSPQAIADRLLNAAEIRSLGIDAAGARWEVKGDLGGMTTHTFATSARERVVDEVAVGVGQFPTAAAAANLVHTWQKDLSAAEAPGGYPVHAEVTTHSLRYDDAAFQHQSWDGTQWVMIARGRYVLLLVVSIDAVWLSDAANFNTLRWDEKARQTTDSLLGIVYPRFAAATPGGSGTFGAGLAPDVQEALRRIIARLLKAEGRSDADVQAATAAGATGGVIMLLTALLLNLMNGLGLTLPQAIQTLDARMAAGEGKPPAPPVDPRLAPLRDPRSGDAFTINDGRYPDVPVGHVYLAGRWVERGAAEQYVHAARLNLTDPGDGQPLLINDGRYPGVPIGQVWAGEWMDLAEAQRYLRGERMEQLAQRDAEREAFWTEARRLDEEAMRRRVADLEAEAAAERAANAAKEKAWQDLQSINDAAGARGYDDILRRAENDAYNADGSLRLDYIEKLKAATRARLGRDIAAPDESLRNKTGGWIVEGLEKTADDAAHSVVVRLGAGILTAGSSEVFFQSVGAWDAMQKAAEEAAKQGKDLDFTDALATGYGSLARQNLPINTLEKLGEARSGKELGWMDVAGALLADAGAVLNVRETGRNIAGSFEELAHGAKFGDAARFRDTSSILPESVEKWKNEKLEQLGAKADQFLRDAGFKEPAGGGGGAGAAFPG